MPPNDPFRALFDAHADFVWRVLARHRVPERELEDACQEVFMVVHRRLGEFEQRSSLRTWLYGIAVRVALGQRRRARHVHEQLEAVPPEEAAGPEQERRVADWEDLALVERALHALTPERREVFVLYEVEGMTMAEVGEALAIPETTALYRLYGARDDVKAWLAREGLRSEQRKAKAV